MSAQTDLQADARPSAIDHVQLAAPPGCEQLARDFYGGLLGLREIEKPVPLRARGGAWFGLGTGQLHIGVETEFAPARKAHPALSVPLQTEAGGPAGLQLVGRRHADAALCAVARCVMSEELLCN